LRWGNVRFALVLKLLASICDAAGFNTSVNEDFGKSILLVTYLLSKLLRKIYIVNQIGFLNSTSLREVYLYKCASHTHAGGMITKKRNYEKILVAC